MDDILDQILELDALDSLDDLLESDFVKRDGKQLADDTLDDTLDALDIFDDTSESDYC